MCNKRPIYQGQQIELHKVSDEELLNYIRKYKEIIPQCECTTRNIAAFLKFEYGIVDTFTYKHKGLRNRLNYIQSQPNSPLHHKCVTGSYCPCYFIWSVE